METIYTLGYAGWTLGQVADVVQEKNALLLDVRLSPYSRKPGFKKPELESRLPYRYLHIEELGNVNYQGGPIELNDFEAGRYRVANFRWLEDDLVRNPDTVIFMCGCKDYRRCHRTKVVDMIVEWYDERDAFDRMEIVHLEPPAEAEAGHIKALTLHQPWASLIALAGHGHETNGPYRGKHYETRSWRTSYRGLLAIHAAKTKKSLAHAKELPINSALVGGLGYTTIGDIPRGKVVAVAHLTDCISTDDRSWVNSLTDVERAFGNYQPGRWAWKLENIRRLEEPVPVRGYQGLWDLPRELIRIAEMED